MKEHIRILRGCVIGSMVLVGLSANAAVPTTKSVASKQPAPEAKNPADQIAYQQLVDAFEENDFEIFERKFNEFRKQHAESSYTDDAMYMLGMLHVGRKEYGTALKVFNDAVKMYPTGNRVRALLLSKATMLKRMNLSELAIPALERVKQRFPGSPEALRADVELKLIKQQ